MSYNLKKKIENSKFDNVKNFKYFIIAPLVTILVAVIMLCFVGFNKGIEFTGGTMVNIYIGEELEQEDVYNDAKQKVDQVLVENGIKASVYQTNTTDVGLCLSVRYQDKAGLTNSEMETLNLKINDKLYTVFNYDKDNVVEKDYVLGGQRIDASVGAELLVNSLTAILIASILVAIYLMFRFGIASSLSSFLCVEHDMLIALSSIIIFRLELTSSIISVLIAILAFSFMNNTLLFDGVKEIIKEEVVGKNSAVANLAVKKSLYRIILATILALLAFLSLALFGNEFAFNIAFPIMAGIFASFYSTIFLAPALWSFAYVRKNKIKKEKYLNKEQGVV